MTLAGCAVIVLGSWAICARNHAVDRGGAYNSGVFAILILVAASLTLGSAMAVVGAWRSDARPVAASLVSLLASASILMPAVPFDARG